MCTSRSHRFCSLGLLWLLLVSLFGLSSCGFTATGDTVADFVKKYGAQAYDRGLVHSEFFICRAASVGAVGRRYWSNPEKFNAWIVLCADVPVDINEVALVPEYNKLE